MTPNVVCQEKRPADDARLEPRIRGGGENLWHRNSFCLSLMRSSPNDRILNNSHARYYRAAIKVNINRRFDSFFLTVAPETRNTGSGRPGGCAQPVGILSLHVAISFRSPSPETDPAADLGPGPQSGLTRRTIPGRLVSGTRDD